MTMKYHELSDEDVAAELLLSQKALIEERLAADHLLNQKDHIEEKIDELRFAGMFAPTSAERLKAQNELTEMRIERARVDEKLGSLDYE